MLNPAFGRTLSACARTLRLGLAILSAAASARADCDLVAVATGQGHTVALTEDGNVLAWGMNAWGQVGTGAFSFAIASPVPVAGVSGAIAVAAGDHFSLALRADGRVLAWGRNRFGNLGNGGTGDVPTAIVIPGLDSVVAIAAGSEHALALRSDGRVWAWGGTWAGQFASPALGFVAVPQPTPVTGATRIAAGGTSSLALDDSGWVVAMGPLAGPNSLGPVFVAGLDAVVEIAAGGDVNGLDHGLARRGDGSVLAWGHNGWGQLGDGSTTRRDTPVPIPALAEIKAIAAGAYHSTAITRSATLRSWGRNEYGQLGDGSYSDSSLPVAVAGIADVHAIAAGGQHSAAILSNGALRSWGWSGFGQLGRLGDSFTSTSRWLPVASFGTVVESSTRGDSTVWSGAEPSRGLDHTLSLDGEGRVWASGANRHGQLGNGNTVDQVVPVAVAGLDAVVGVAAGARHSLALRSDGSVWAWGANEHGQLGDGAGQNRLAPVLIPGLGGVIAIAASDRDSLALGSDGSLWHWGWYAGRDVPSPVPGSSASFVALAAGSTFFLALDDDGTVWAWGWNDQGQLGNDSPLPWSDTPVPVADLSEVIAIAAGGSHALALRVDGTMVGWGGNARGQLGTGSLTAASRPQAIAIPGPIIAIAAGSEHSLAADYNGNVYAWGRNFAGESGASETGNLALTMSPRKLAGLQAISQLAAGTTTSLAWNGEGNLYGWGWNGVGQLGDGSSNRSPFPGEVLLDTVPATQGNILHLVKNGGDVRLSFAGGTANVYAIYRDADKSSIGTSVFEAPVVATAVVDDGALSRPANDLYAVKGLSACSLGPEQ